MQDGNDGKLSVYIALLSYTGIPEPKCLEAIRDAIEDAAKEGIEVELDRMVRNSLVADARNSMIARFLAHPKKPTLLFWWDDDVEPERGGFLELVKSGVDFAAAIYRTKTEDVHYPLCTLQGPGQPMQTDPETGLLEHKMTAMGFSCLSREGIEKMCQAYPRTYTQHVLKQPVPYLFQCGVPDGEDTYWGEDNWYCDRWTKIGGRIWIEPEMTMRHWGWKDPLNPQLGKSDHAGHYGDWLRNRPGSGAFDRDIERAKQIAREMGCAVDDPAPLAHAESWKEDPTAGSIELGHSIDTISALATIAETRIAVCIPTRGKPEYLNRFLAMSIGNCVLKNTQFVVAVDDDDFGKMAREALDITSPRSLLSIGPREDALGAKYNRCMRYVEADIYVMGLDDVGIATQGWDAMLASAAAKAPNDIGAFHFGKEPHGEYLPSFIAWTKKLCELADGFCPEIFPFWWNNTWNYEIAELAGIITDLPQIKSAYPETFPAPARRDILYWGRVFDELRPTRAGIAKRVRAALIPDASLATIADWEQMTTNEWPKLMKEQEHRNSRLRDPEFCKTLERDMSLPETDMARHIRLKGRAEVMLPGIGERNAADLGGTPVRGNPVKREVPSEVRQAFGRGWTWPAADVHGWEHPKEAWPAIRALVVEHCTDATQRRVVVQAGGCCGMYPALLAAAFRTVYTFELDPINFRYLMRNCEAHPNVIAMNAALGHMRGCVGVDRPWDKNVGNYYVDPAGGAIPTLRVDDLQLSVCDALLLDTEGAEAEVMAGAWETIARCRPRLIIIETVPESLQNRLAVMGYGHKGKVSSAAGHDDVYFVDQWAERHAVAMTS